MEQLLQGWGLPELIEIFQDNSINDEEILSELIDSRVDLQELIPLPGLRLKLQKKFREYVQNKDQNIELADIKVDSSQILITPKESEFIQNSVPASSQVIENEEANIELGEDAIEEVEIVQIGDEQQGSKKRKLNRIDNEVVKLALEEHPLGSAIQIYSYCKETLDTVCQSYLTTIVINYCLKTYGFVLDNADLEKLAHEIVQIFPNECVETYYIPPIKKKDSRDASSGRSKGKLVDKYRNIKTFVRGAENLLKNRGVKKQILVKEEANPNPTEALESKAWLIYNRDPQEILQHWNLSYSLRVLDAQNQEYQILANIFDGWPILKDSGSYKLIELDFLKKYDKSFEKIYLKWNEVLPSLMRLNLKKLLSKKGAYTDFLESECFESFDEDFKTFVELELLSSLLPKPTTKISLPNDKSKKRKKCYWKPDELEAREGIVIHVLIPGDIENAVETKRAAMLKLKQPTQPFVIVVGPNIASLNAFYVRLDSVMYQVTSLLRALDVLFKIYITYSVRYPIQSENIAYFIQWSIYDIHTKEDAQVPAIYNILNQLQRVKKSK